MKSFWRALALTCALGAGAAMAQDADNAEPPAGLSMGETIVDGRVVGEEYVSQQFAAWAHRCVTTADGNDPCSIYQLLLDDTGNSVAEISIARLSDTAEAVAIAGGNVVTPLGTLLSEQLTIQVDDQPARRYPFAFCTAAGCLARVGFTTDDVAAFKAGSRALVRLVPATAPDQEVILVMSLSGFTAAYDALPPR